MEPKKILILGSKGMLGQELARVFGADESYAVTAWDREEIDIADFPEAEQKILSLSPDIIVNAAAYNDVDGCETNDEEYTRALLLNEMVPNFLADLVEREHIVLVHFSTDYVFDGEEKGGYDESARPHPISRYGETKRRGEVAMQSFFERGGTGYLVRLSKLFGKPAASAGGKKSFFEKMLEVSEGKSEVTGVDDETSCFTYAPDLASAVKSLIEDEAVSGIYHLVNEGAVSWYEGAQELFRIVGREVSVKPVPGSTFPRPAKRPHFSVLRNTKRPKLRHYAEALQEFLGGVR